MTQVLKTACSCPHIRLDEPMRDPRNISVKVTEARGSCYHKTGDIVIWEIRMDSGAAK